MSKSRDVIISKRGDAVSVRRRMGLLMSVSGALEGLP
jgi:hypothetical protein